eukprot:gene34250-3232_t
MPATWSSLFKDKDRHAAPRGGAAPSAGPASGAGGGTDAVSEQQGGFG